MQATMRLATWAPAGRYPTGLACAPAYFAPLVVCGLAGGAGSLGRLAAEVGVLALVVAVVGFESTAAAALVAAGSALLSLNGFAENGLGALAPHLRTDPPAAAVLLLAAVLGWLARESMTDGTHKQGVE